MQPKKKSISSEIELNPIFAYRNRNSLTNKSTHNYRPTDQTQTTRRSKEKKAFHPPIFKNITQTLQLMSKPASTLLNSNLKTKYSPVNTVAQRKGTDTTLTTESDVSFLTSRPIKEFDPYESIIPTNKSSKNNSLTITASPISNTNTNVFIKKRISRSPINYLPPQQRKFDKKQNEFIINLEDLMLLEIKLCDILSSITNKSIMSNSCFEWWNFYFNCSLNGNLEHYFFNAEFKSIIQFYSNVQFLAIMIIYDLSFDDKLFKILQANINNVIHLLHKSFLVICDYLLLRIKKEFSSFVWVNKLRELLKYKKGYMVSPVHIDDIIFNSNCAYEYIRLILINSNMSLEINTIFQQLFDDIKAKTAEDFNKTFLSSVLRIANPKGSVVASFLIKSSEKMAKVKIPYITSKPTKPFTLVLDLDETLMSFVMSEKDETQGLMRLRPGLYDFLDSVSRYYELIVFTAATQDYADPILDAIENGQHYFAYRFYREHTVIVQNDFVKDITRIGREIYKTIIVDNMPQNFRLQKENGILILSFLGEDQDDIALLGLEKILIQIANEGEDVRVSLRKYKDDITKNVSSKIYKNGL